MAYDIDDLKLRISKAKMTLFTRGMGTTFFSALLSGLRIEITTDMPTACVDGITMRFNPDFINPLPTDELLGLMMHELGHVIYDHIGRCMAWNLNHKLWNIAGDHYINLWLLSLGFKLPPKGIHDFKYRGWSTMQIYKDLQNNPPPNDPNYMWDIGEIPPGMDESTFKEKLNSNILKAVDIAQARKDAGSIPADILRHVENITNPILPWQTILQNELSGMSKDDFSWSRPNRRYMPHDIYLPHRWSENLNQITCGDDVSGSMNQDDLNEIFHEQKYIWEVMKPTRMRVQTFDLQVHMDKVFTEGDTLDDLELIGGGGTDVTPLIESIKKEMPELALIFTDGGFYPPDMTGTEATKIFWIIKGNKGFTNPVGKIIHF